MRHRQRRLCRALRNHHRAVPRQAQIRLPWMTLYIRRHRLPKRKPTSPLAVSVLKKLQCNFSLDIGTPNSVYICSTTILHDHLTTMSAPFVSCYIHLTIGISPFYCLYIIYIYLCFAHFRAPGIGETVFSPCIRLHACTQKKKSEESWGMIISLSRKHCLGVVYTT